MTGQITAQRGILRCAHQGKVRYGLWEQGGVRLYNGSPFGGGEPAGRQIDAAELRLLAPCRPGKVVAIGLNYRQHAAEMKLALPDEPMMFLKPASSVIGPGEKIVSPAMSQRVDYEAELGVVIGRKARQVSEAEAGGCILGYTCLNDVTARDLQAKDGQYTRAKGFDTFCPLGPIIATDLDPADLAVRSYLDGELHQDGRTSDLIFPVPRLVSFISQVMTLNPGDVIATGTPSGIGPMRKGQTITIEIQGIGQLVNPVG